MNSTSVLKDIAYELIWGNLPETINNITDHMDTRKICEGDLFVCISGARFDSHDALDTIIEKGVSLIVISQEKKSVVLDALLAIRNKYPKEITKCCVIAVEDVRYVKAIIMNNWYDHPAKKMIMIGITGSKGKTTTTNMITKIVEASGKKVGTIGSTGAVFDNKVIELANSTPDAEEIQKYLSDMVKAGCEVAVVECSSQGLMQHRVAGIAFDYGIFMNIVEGDHVAPNEHKSFEDYLRCKSLLFLQSKEVIVNLNSEHIDELMNLLHGYGIVNTQFFADEVTPKVEKMLLGEDILPTEAIAEYATCVEEIYDKFRPQVHMTVVGQNMDHARVRINFPGRYQVTNALAAITVCAKMGISSKIIDEALNEITVKGRLEMVYQSDKFSVCVDFAHNGFSTRSLLKSLRAYKPKRLVCIFGADGNRAISRRTEMGEASGRLADLSIVTSGHNRFETFEQIFKDIAVGLSKTEGSYIVIPNRKEAIRYAIDHVEEGDLIAIIGLGQETYQEENGVKYPYSDTEFVLQTIKEKIC